MSFTAPFERIDAGETDWQSKLAIGLSLIFVWRIGVLLLNSTDLFLDEAQYWVWSQEPAFGYFSKPPLIAWIISGFTSVCGNTEFCVRLPSPFFHILTALAIFATARRLYDDRIGFWSAIGVAILPSASLSAGIISADVPLLFFWSVALYLFTHYREKPSLFIAVLLGITMGVGLNAKYAMIYFIPCVAIYLLAAKDMRSLARRPDLYIAVIIAVVMLIPNALWNVENGLATFRHTAGNANWRGSLFHPEKAMEFLLSQFIVFGPILFTAFLVIAWKWARRGLNEPDLLLFAFSAPVFMAITIQAILSRAYANWAGVAVAAATILVTAHLLRQADERWFKWSTMLHVAIAVVIAIGTATAGKLGIPSKFDPFARVTGWKAYAAPIKAELRTARKQGIPYRSVVGVQRKVTAQLIYQLRDEDVLVFAWPNKPIPHDHFELTRAFDIGSPEPVLLISLFGETWDMTHRFKQIATLPVVEAPGGEKGTRQVHMFRLSGFVGHIEPIANRRR